jgi:MFS family permease
MAIVDRVKNICLSPSTEWPVIAAESGSAGSLISGYVAPLAAVGAIAGLVGGSIIGRTIPFVGSYRVPIVAGVSLAIFTFVMAIVGVVILGLIINALAPSFGGEKNSMQALKVAVYSYTPAWVAGVLQIFPLLGMLGLLAALYGLYLLYLGLPRLMKSPEDKALGYTVVVVICAIVLSAVVFSIGGVIAGAGAVGAGALGGFSSVASQAASQIASQAAGQAAGQASAGAARQVEFDKDSPLGRLEALGKKLDENNNKIEAAEKRGDTGAQVAAAAEGLGLILGGGRHVDPIGIDQLKPFVPETFLGMKRTSSNAEKNGIAGFMVSKAEATYADGSGKNITLAISDTGGASGLVGLANWASLQGEQDNDDHYERVTKVNGRLVHEQRSKRAGGTNEFGVVLGERFVVNAAGNGVDLNELKSAVSNLDLGKLESMKEVGVQR